MQKEKGHKPVLCQQLSDDHPLPRSMRAVVAAWFISAYNHCLINEAALLAGRSGAAGKWVDGIYIDFEKLGRKIEWCRDGGIVVCF